MKKLIFLIIIIFFTISCNKKEFVIMIEQPSSYKLDKLKVGINIDDKEIENINLKATKITPSILTKVFVISEEGKHNLKIKLKDTLFSYEINYPEEKYIIISPYLEKNGEINVGMLKQKDKFVFH